MVKMVCFDMDGTLANLYDVNNWEYRLNTNDFTPYYEAKPLYNMSRLALLTKTLIEAGVEVRILTWASMKANSMETKVIKLIKKAWLEKYGFNFTNLHCVKYGTTKSKIIKKYLKEGESAILIDDNENIRKGWKIGKALPPEEIFNLDKYL